MFDPLQGSKALNGTMDSLPGNADALQQSMNARLAAQRSEQLAEARRFSDFLAGRLQRYRANVAEYQADRAIANAESQRALSRLASKFSMIAKIQQILG